MKKLSSIIFFVLTLHFSFAALAQQKESADSLVRLISAAEGQLLEIDSVKYRKIIGPATFLHNDTYMLCDTAMWNVNSNRIYAIGNVKVMGEVKYNGMDIFGKDVDVNELRKNIGMVFQKPNPFPMSIYDNIAYGPRTHGIKNKVLLDDIVEESLRSAAIWGEVKDRLKKSALGLSGGQQQRLCIARALAVKPKILLMDEPTSALDPISTSKIEDLATELKSEYTIVVVTHNMQQAVRISDNTAFFLMGEMVEYGNTENLFAMPKDERTEAYITGRFG